MLPPGESRRVYAVHSIRVRKRWDRRTDGRQSDALRLSLDAVRVIISQIIIGCATAMKITCFVQNERRGRQFRQPHSNHPFFRLIKFSTHRIIISLSFILPSISLSLFHRGLKISQISQITQHIKMLWSKLIYLQQVFGHLLAVDY